MHIEPAWLAPTAFLDHEHAAVREFAERAIGSASDEVEIARRLFMGVRDGIRYDPYVSTRDAADFSASHVATTTRNWCIPKSVLFAAAARHAGIPARLGFADVRNHLTSAKLSASMGSDLFAWHGYAVLLLNGQWRKYSTAFNVELCEKFGTKVLEFSPDSDCLMHPYDVAGNRHMEYVQQRGTYDDLPLDEIFATFAEVYPNWDFAQGAGNARSAGDEAFS